MRRFRYDINRLLRITMLAAGGFLILALAGKYEKEWDKEPGKALWEEHGREMAARWMAAVFENSYPGLTMQKETGNGQGTEYFPGTGAGNGGSAGGQSGGSAGRAGQNDGQTGSGVGGEGQAAGRAGSNAGDAGQASEQAGGNAGGASQANEQAGGSAGGVSQASRAVGAGSGGKGISSWNQKLAVWLKERNPRVRYRQLQSGAHRGYRDEDPAFGDYLESQRVVKESSYLLFGGGEETGTDKADLAGGYGTGGGAGEGGETNSGTESSGAVTVQDLAQATVVHHKHKELPVTGTRYVLEQLADYDFLMKNFYSVHSSTTAGREEMDASRLLGEDLTIEKNTQEPQILIYHTHSQETYADYGPDRTEATVVEVGNYLTELLEGKGYLVIHDTRAYDMMEGELNRSKAYDYALKGITVILQEHPSIDVILDIHRDGVREGLHMVSEVNGKPAAPIMFFNGMSQTPEGPIEYLPNPYKEQNLAFTLQMQLDAAAYFPGFTRKIYLKGFRYNLHLRPRSALIEVGAQTNTYEEARNAMEPLAELLDMVLQGEKSESSQH